ncbi:MAG: cell division protein FtsK, partial [Lactobacillaceae bacterium]|nr:cell division protein FtsK [Lactobacillaceae bacterium]
AQHNVRNIEGWNQKVVEYNQTKGQAMHKMPYMIVIVDELADLMMTAKSDVETAIVRIAQMGRAAGIHLILATQRPSVDVITGLIKANVPSRMAFAVSSGIDSRTILDQNGAEKLLGRGDMLFAPIGKEPTRIQGAFIPDNDVIAVTDFIKAQAPAEYDSKMDVENEPDGDFENGEDTSEMMEVDALFDEAKTFVIQQKKASSSLLQRRFRIGYGRAARIIDELEAAGIVGPQDGSRPREILVGLDASPTDGEI